MRIKICGIRDANQGRAIAQLGVTALGFICVPQSPRYVTPLEIQAVVKALPTYQPVDRVGVFVDASMDTILRTVEEGHLNAVQLHGHESPSFCRDLRNRLPVIEIIKAFRIRNPETLMEIPAFNEDVDSFLLDAYHPQLMGGTGQTLNWKDIQVFRSDRPWFLAGGLTSTNVIEAITMLNPDGIDLSSSVEISPGNKDLQKVATLMANLEKQQKTHPGFARTGNVKKM